MADVDLPCTVVYLHLTGSPLTNLSMLALKSVCVLFTFLKTLFSRILKAAVVKLAPSTGNSLPVVTIHNGLAPAMP